MPEYQAYNPKIKAWVKYHLDKDGKAKIKSVKQREPQKPFKKAIKRGKKKK